MFFFGQVKSWNKRFFVLNTEGMLSYFVNDKGGKAKGTIKLKECTGFRVGVACKWSPPDPKVSMTDFYS